MNTRNGSLSIILDGILLNDAIQKVSPGTICNGGKIVEMEGGPNNGGAGQVTGNEENKSPRPAAAAAAAAISAHVTKLSDDFDEEDD